jgi:hypothetical protein
MHIDDLLRPEEADNLPGWYLDWPCFAPKSLVDTARKPFVKSVFHCDCIIFSCILLISNGTVSKLHKSE